jgi:hypothetical protein
MNLSRVHFPTLYPTRIPTVVYGAYLDALLLVSTLAGLKGGIPPTNQFYLVVHQPISFPPSGSLAYVGPGHTKHLLSYYHFATNNTTRTGNTVRYHHSIQLSLDTIYIRHLCVHFFFLIPLVGLDSLHGERRASGSGCIFLLLFPAVIISSSHLIRRPASGRRPTFAFA